MPLVRNTDEVLRNIKRFNKDLPKSSGLQERLPYVRAWYAINDDEQGWMFGPSKFIGYSEMNANKYLSKNIPLDGRQTESRLQDWFSVMDYDPPESLPIWTALNDLLDEYGKSPSKLVRINVMKKPEGDSSRSEHALISALIIEIAGKMPVAVRKSLISKLIAIK